MDDFANYQVLLPDDPDAQAKVIRLIEAYMSGAGWEEIPRPSDYRSIAVGPAGRWIPVYERDTYMLYSDQPAGPDAELAMALSAVGPTVIVEMFDSTCVRLRLYVAGRLLDESAEASEWVTPDRVSSQTPTPALWSCAVAPESDVAALTTAFAKHGDLQLMDAVGCFDGDYELWSGGYTGVTPPGFIEKRWRR